MKDNVIPMFQETVGTLLSGVCSVSHKEHLIIMLAAQIVVQTMMAVTNLVIKRIPWIKSTKISELLLNIPVWIIHRILRWRELCLKETK